LSISLIIATGYVDIAILNILRRGFPELLKMPSLWTHSYYVSTIGLVSKRPSKNTSKSKRVSEMERTNTFIVEAVPPYGSWRIIAPGYTTR
jgi:hypothetical protein